MVLSVSAVTDAVYNDFDPKNAIVGWHDEVTANPDCSFRTSRMISVTAGDVICFGAAVVSQGWHMVTYDAKRKPLRTVTVSNGIEVAEPLNELTAIMHYTVAPGECWLRMICDTRFLNNYLVTKNRIFSAQEYRSLSSEQNIRLIHQQEWLPIECWLILLNVKGSGMMTVGENVFAFEPGSIACIPPGISFRKVSAGGYADMQITATEFMGQKNGSLLLAADDNNRSIALLFQLMAKVYWNPTDHYRPFLEQLYETAQQLLRYQMAEVCMYDPQVTKMTRYMQDHFTDPALSMEQVFRQGEYCPNHLRRLFKRATGCSPLEYLINLRIDHAKKLMRQNGYLGYSVTQIAALSGFEEISYFSRSFKKKVGMSPMQYMKAFNRP